MLLRPYQQKGIADIRELFERGVRRVLYVGPTGSGKTVLFCHGAHKAMQAGKRVTITVHRAGIGRSNLRRA